MKATTTGFVRYKNSNGWHVIVVSAADMIIAGRTISSPTLVAMHEWCIETYGEDCKLAATSVHELANDQAPHAWGFSGYGDLFFKNDSDILLFLLRWSGETRALS